MIAKVSDAVVAFDRGLVDVVDAVHSLSSYVIVLGISDYLDGSKGRSWQPYASLAAAAFTKTIINTIHALSRRSSYYR